MSEKVIVQGGRCWCPNCKEVLRFRSSRTGAKRKRIGKYCEFCGIEIMYPKDILGGKGVFDDVYEVLEFLRSERMVKTYNGETYIIPKMTNKTIEIMLTKEEFEKLKTVETNDRIIFEAEGSDECFTIYNYSFGEGENEND